MVQTFLDQNQYQIERHHIIYHYLDKTFLLNVQEGFQEIELNSVEADIVECINTVHDLERVWKQIAKEYDFSDQDEEAKILFDSLIDDLLDKKVLEPGNGVVCGYGEVGRCYPATITIELTNACNFRCTHCYKEAGNCNKDFISVEAVGKIMRKLQNKVYSVEITGGEATLHPQFIDIVKQLNAPAISLLTNGSYLHRFDNSILQKFTSIQISLYGCSEEEYLQFALSDQFNNVCKGIKKVVELGIPLTIAIILRKSNIDRIEQYINLLLELGVNHVRFGSSLKVGRNKRDAITDWDISKEECARFERRLKLLRGEYPTVRFDEFEENEEFSFDPNKKQYHFRCNAGKKFVAFSEKERVRPCLYTPAQFFEILSLDEYFTLIKKGENYDYSGCIECCLKDLRAQHRGLDTICPYGFD